MQEAYFTAADQRRYVRFGTVTVVLLVLWVSVLMAIALTVIPDGYWYSYYSVDYAAGFVRRGLAGELRHLVPSGQYFTQLKVLRWFLTALFVLSLIVLSCWLSKGFDRYPRRLLLVLLIPVLPCGVAFGIFSARTDLFGVVVLIGFSLALTRLRLPRSILLASAVYGAIIAILTLIHEAIPFLFGLGALMALSVLAGQIHRKTLVSSSVLAVAPGVVTALLVAVLGRRGASAQLCELVPHGPVNHPLAGNPTMAQLLRGFHYDVDYHDWMCRAILPLYDQNFGDALHFVSSLGVAALLASTLWGAGLLALTVWLISTISGVPLSRFSHIVRQHWVSTLAGVVLLVPVFLTGVDWIRWWVIMSFDIGIVFLLYAAVQPEVYTSPTRKTVRVFILGAAALALIPAGIIPGFGAPIPM